MLVSVPTPANPRGVARPERTTKSVPAACVGDNLPSTGTLTQEPATVHVVRVYAGKNGVPVYNLSVEDTPEFFANGVLVHNCDCARYALFSFTTIGTSTYTTAKLRGVW